MTVQTVNLPMVSVPGVTGPTVPNFRHLCENSIQIPQNRCLPAHKKFQNGSQCLTITGHVVGKRNIRPQPLLPRFYSRGRPSKFVTSPTPRISATVRNRRLGPAYSDSQTTVYYRVLVDTFSLSHTIGGVYSLPTMHQEYLT
jgi:hypothetical protein